MAQYFASSGLNAILENISKKAFGFFRKDDSVIGIDIGSSAIKVVQLKKKDGKAILETYGELALGPYAHLAIGQATSITAEKIAQALIDVMREASITAKNVGIAIPLSSSLITIIEMMTVQGARLKDMVPLEARKYIPIPMSEVNLDWRIIPDGRVESLKEHSDEAYDNSSTGKPLSQISKRKKVKILLAAIHNEILNRYQHIANTSDLDVSFFEIEVFSSIRSLLGRERGTVLILDIGAGTSKLLTVEEGVIVSSHVINRGSQDITIALARSQSITTTKAEEMKREVGFSKDPIHRDKRELMALIINTIFSDANRVLIDYEKKYHKAVDKIILSGGGSLLKGIEEVAKQNFDMEVVRANPFFKVETPAFLEPILMDAGPNFAVALGLALRYLEANE